MCLDIKLEGEFGDQIDYLDDNCILAALIERSFKENRDAIRLLDFVDFYGNTVFNRIQMPKFETEVQALHEFAHDQEQHDFIDKFLNLIAKCKSEVHLYLKIYGD